jgi:hypothetical protein
MNVHSLYTKDWRQTTETRDREVRVKSIIVTRDGMEWELIDSQIVAEDKDNRTIRNTYSPKIGLPVSVDIIIAQKQGINDGHGESVE